MILNNKQVFIDYLLYPSNIMENSKLNILFEGVITSVFAVSSKHAVEFCSILSDLQPRIESIMKNYHMSSIGYLFFRLVFHCVYHQLGTLLSGG